MSVVLALGTNQGDLISNLKKAISRINLISSVVEVSRIYESEPFGPIPQPNFYNLVLESTTPKTTPTEYMNSLLEIELQMGRIRNQKWGPRIIDIDILFWEDQTINSSFLTIPHPLIQQRSFVLLPLSEITFYNKIKNKYPVPNDSKFLTHSWPLEVSDGFFAR